MLAHSFSTDIGRLTAVESDGRVVMILLANHPPADMAEGETRLLLETERQITQYLSGERGDFDLPVGTGFIGFRKDVMDAMARIPYGTTVSYGELARDPGTPVLTGPWGQCAGSTPCR